MQMDDMILVSIDDHMVEPPDMYENHVPAKWQDQVPKVVRNDAGRRRVGVPGRGDRPPRSAWPPPSAGRERSGASTRARYSELRPGLLRRARAGARHGRQRRARVDELPDDGRLQRAHVHRGGRQGARARHAPGLQRLGHRRVVPAATPAGSSRWASSRCGTSTSRSRRCTALGKKGCRSISFLETPHVAGLPELPLGPLGPDARGDLRREHGPVAAHRRRLRRHQQAARGADRPPHGARLPDQRASPRRTCCSGRRCAQFPDLKVALSEGGIGWIPFYFDRIDRHFQNQAWLHDGNDFGGKLPSEVFREHILACYITDPSGLAAAATGSASTSSPGSATTPTPTRRGPSRPSSPGRSSRTPAAPTTRSTRSPGRTPAGSSTGTRSQHTPKEEATVGALRATRRPTSTPPACRAPSGEANEAAGIGSL